MLNIDVPELQRQYDKVKVMTCSIAPVQHLAKLQEGQQLRGQVEEAQRKEAMLKARLGPWLDEAYKVTTNIQEKLMGLQTTQQTMKLTTEGPDTE